MACPVPASTCCARQKARSVAMDVLIRDQRELRQLRRVVGDFARSAGSRAGDIVLAVNELVTNSLMYGGGSCRVLGTCPTDQLVRIEDVDPGWVWFGFPA